MARFTDKVAVVTGASKGIGAGIAKRLAAEGATVVVNYASDAEGAKRIVDAIEAADGRAVAVGASVANQDEVARLFEDVRKAFGRVDVLVNNAGIYAMAPIESISAPDFNRQFATNVLGLLQTTKASLPLFPATGGSIVNISSVVSTLAPPASAIYAGTKGAVELDHQVPGERIGAAQDPGQRCQSRIRDHRRNAHGRHGWWRVRGSGGLHEPAGTRRPAGGYRRRRRLPCLRRRELDHRRIAASRRRQRDVTFSLVARQSSS